MSGLLYFTITMLCTLCATQSTPPETRRGVPLFQMKGGDPVGEKDSFMSLSSSEQAGWGGNSGKNLYQMRKDFQNLEMKVRVDIRLVGFDGEGLEGLFMPSSQVVFQLRSLKPELKSLALQRLNSALWGETDLGVQTKVMYQVSKVRPSLCNDITTKISEAVNKERTQVHTPDDGAVYISHEIVDEVLAADYSRSGSLPTVYILNPKMPATKYVYSYKTRDACPGTLWTSSNQRYFWIDLTAGPVTYGPSESGEGRVLSHSIPRVEHYNEAWRSKAMIPDISALIFSGTKHLITPASMNLYQKDWLKMDIQIIHVHDTMSPSKAIQEISEYEEIIKELQQVVLPGQSVHVEHFYVGFGHCSACVAAYSRARQSKTERMPGAGMNIASSTYLDSEILYAWLSDEDFQDELTDNHGQEIQLKAESPKRILPVFIFEISSFDSLVLDGKSPTESFPDMVVAVRTHGGAVSSGFTCMEKRLPIDTTRIFRPLLASILTSGWGVLNTAQSISTGNQEVQMDYTWSVGNTIYGYLATTPTLSFSQKDAARRNTILAKIHGLILQTDAALRGFANISSTGYIHDALSSKKEVATFLQRLDILLFKMQTSVARLGMMEYDEAWYFARSAKHDITELYGLAQSASELSVSVVQCPGKRGRLKFWLLGMIGLGMGTFFGILRKFKRKKKRQY